MTVCVSDIIGVLDDYDVIRLVPPVDVDWDRNTNYIDKCVVRDVPLWAWRDLGNKTVKRVTGVLDRLNNELITMILIEYMI